MTLRQIRKAKEISQGKMAELLGVHVNTYIHMEKNPDKIPLCYAIKICEIFGIEPDFIIFLPFNSTNT